MLLYRIGLKKENPRKFGVIEKNQTVTACNKRKKEIRPLLFYNFIKRACAFRYHKECGEMFALQKELSCGDNLKLCNYYGQIIDEIFWYVYYKHYRKQGQLVSQGPCTPSHQLFSLYAPYRPFSNLERHT